MSESNLINYCDCKQGECSWSPWYWKVCSTSFDMTEVLKTTPVVIQASEMNGLNDIQRKLLNRTFGQPKWTNPTMEN